MSQAGQTVSGGAGLVHQVRNVLDAPQTGPKLIAFDFDNTLVVTPSKPQYPQQSQNGQHSQNSQVGAFQIHGGKEMRDLLSAITKRPDLHICIVSARKRTAKLSQLVDVLRSLGLDEVFDLKRSLDEVLLKHEGEGGEVIKVKTNGSVVGAGFQKPAALAYVVDRYFSDVKEVYFFDDNCMNAHEVEHKLKPLALEVYQRTVAVSVWWVDIFAELDLVEWERNTDFPYHPTEKRVDGTVVVRPLFEPYLTYYGISNEEALSRLKQYDAKYKT